MARVPLHEVEPGAVLGAPVLDPRGRVLLQRGTALTASLIARLEKWSVTAVELADDGNGTSTAGDVAHPARSDEALTARWQQLFAPHAEDEELAVVLQALVRWHDLVRAGRES